MAMDEITSAWSGLKESRDVSVQCFVSETSVYLADQRSFQLYLCTYQLSHDKDISDETKPDLI